MANQYSSGRGGREPRSNYEDRGQERSYWGGSDRDDDRSGRGWFERAGDEVASWFGDDDRDRNRNDDPMARSRPSSDRDYSTRDPRYRDEGYRRPYTGRFMGRSGFNRFGGDRDEPRSEQRNEYRPMTGDYGRAGRENAERQSSSGQHDPHYSEWRRRHLESLDRDYDDYRRENQSRFESDFSSWRGQRMTKRQMLGQVKEHMDVVGSDDAHVGTVDKVRGDKIVLTKSDSADQHHHTIGCSMLERVEDDKVVLNCKADEAKAKFGSTARDMAYGERDDGRRDEGAHILERSFSGTY